MMLRAAYVSAVLAAVSLGPGAALAQTDPNAAAIAALKTYELPDHTASVRLPASWKVVATGVGFIQATGPHGELALFGVMIPAKDASPAGLSAGGIIQPYAADATQRFLASVDWVRAHNGKPAVQAVFYSNTPITAPPAFGNCANITAVLNGVAAVESDFCSLPVDNAGNYRNFFKAVGLPVAVAKQERSLMEAILASYRLNIQAISQQQAVQTKAPAAPAPVANARGSMSATVSAQNSLVAGQLMMAEANAISAQTAAMQQVVNNSVSDFDHGVLRGDTPVYREGDPEPLFWVGN
ncbi:MAG: hypothetical protein P4L54_06490 [Acidocella sp.]|nr:hypothetical protein [Acidocella sp.]